VERVGNHRLRAPSTRIEPRAALGVQADFPEASRNLAATLKQSAHP
jgi:hypothetical protein